MPLRTLMQRLAALALITIIVCVLMHAVTGVWGWSALMLTCSSMAAGFITWQAHLDEQLWNSDPDLAEPSEPELVGVIDLSTLAVPVSPLSDRLRRLSAQRAAANPVGRPLGLDAEPAHIDEVTGLLNRKGLLAAYARHLGHQLGAIHLDLEGFQALNHHHGYEAGDQVLDEMAGRLDEIVPHRSVVARLSGDEFFVLFASTPDITEHIAKRLAARCNEQITIEGGSRVTISIRAGWSSGRAEADKGLMRNATFALQQAKSNAVSVAGFDEEAAARLEQRRLTEVELRTALGSSEFELWAQPIVDIAERRVVSLEMLLRWNHPTKGLISPGSFLCVAQECDLMDEIDRWTVRTACAHARTADPQLRFSINLSSHFLAKPSGADFIMKELAQAGLPAARIQIELKDTDRRIDPKLVIESTRRLSERGISVALDEFGTGYSSLANLLQMSISTIKLDQTLVGLASQPEGRGVISAFHSYASHRGRRLIATGVETAAESANLEQLGCRYQQGHYHGRPQPIADALAQLTTVSQNLDERPLAALSL